MSQRYVKENDDYILEIWHEGSAIYGLYREKPDLITNWKMIRQQCEPDEFNAYRPILELELTQ